jgi:hypothetical protein
MPSIEVRIRAEGALRDTDLQELAGFRAVPDAGGVVLRGAVVDQAALMGVLCRLRRAGLSVRDVDKVPAPSAVAKEQPVRHRNAPGAVARIAIVGNVADLLEGAFGSVSVMEEPATTTIEIGVRDTAELYAVLDRLETLALELHELHVRPGPVAE